MATTVVLKTCRRYASPCKTLKPLSSIRHNATVSDRIIPSEVAQNSKKPCFGPATFSIKDGPTFRGKSFGAKTNANGEAVFTTSLVGYPESMTDPSYRSQILVFTQPLIGNYGVPAPSKDEFGLLRHFESPNIQPSGIVVGDVALQYSHWTAVEGLADWCAREGVAAISGVDTRAIVHFLRDRGSSQATIALDSDRELDTATGNLLSDNLVKTVSIKRPWHIPSSNGGLHIALIDCGVKQNIIRSLVSRGASVTCLPFDFPIQNYAHHFDGVFISNGPGDPTRCKDTSDNLRHLMDTSRIPIMGICLGHQLLAIAAGAKTVKMKYGNRAHNIPALDLKSGQCHITSQNHGYAVDVSTLPADFEEYFVNLNDGSNEGIMHRRRPIFSTQFHPEAKGGPWDSSYLFDDYLAQVRAYRQNHLSTHRKSRSHFLSVPLLVDMVGREYVGTERHQHGL